MNKIIILMFLVIFLFCESIAWASSKSLCSPAENVLFTCSVGKKLVSVCSSNELSQASGYVQYRFGARNQIPELLYPTEKVHPSSKFSFGYTGSAKSSLFNLHFSISGNLYTIYQQLAAFDENGSGIRVKTSAGKSSHLRCTETSPRGNLEALDGLRLRVLPEESLVSLDSDETWPAESPNADLLQGVRTHDFSLVSQALTNGADVNFHPPGGVGVLSALVDERWQAIRQNRVAEFDEETDRLLTLLLSRGASPTISSQNGGTVIDFLANKAPLHTIQKLLDIGWPNDYHYRLYVAALLGNPAIVAEALNNGADPNKPIRGSRHILVAITKASSLSEIGEEANQKQALAAMELLLKAGAKIDEGTPKAGDGDIVLVSAYFGNRPNIKPVLDLLAQYASPKARQNSLYWLKIGNAGSNPERQANLDWLIKRLAQ